MQNERAALRIRELCAEKGLTIDELAKRAGVSRAAICAAMEDDWWNASIELIKKVCDGADISLREFFADFLF